MVTRQGIYRHYRGGLYTVLFVARNSTNGPDEGKNVVVYVSHKDGYVSVRDEEQFHELVPAAMPPADQPGMVMHPRPRFSFAMAQLSDREAEDLYDDLLTLTGRKQ